MACSNVTFYVDLLMYVHTVDESGPVLKFTVDFYCIVACRHKTICHTIFLKIKEI